MKRRRFKQLTRADRLNIEKYLRQGMTKQAVADALGVSLRTVYYELKRGQYIHTNSDLTEEVRYSCDVAESVKKYNGTNKGPQLKIGNDHELAAYIERRIVEDGYSPAAVLGEIRVKGMKFKTSICNRRQWFRVCRRRRHGTKLSPKGAADEGLLLPPLFFLGTRDQRKHERPDPPLVPEGDGLQQSQRPGNPEGRRLAERLSPRNPGLPIC